MPLTVTNLNKKTGFFQVENNRGKVVGTGRAKASKTHNGMVTLFFDRATYRELDKGLRVPINWLDNG